MLKSARHLLLSASDLAGHLNCRHLTELDLEVATQGREASDSWDPLLEVLWQRGTLHEQNSVAHLQDDSSH
jgi:uncharacterized protein